MTSNSDGAIDEQRVVDLPDAGTPADQGLSSLGLLMQLAGTVLAAQVTIATFFMLFALRTERKDSLWIFLILGLCVARSMFHRQAGVELLYGRRTGLDGASENPLTGLKRYITVGFVQSAILFAVFYGKFKVGGRLSFAIFVGLAAWPLILSILLGTGRFRRFSTEIPVAEDKGFEGAAILMTIFGLCGVLGTGTVLLVLLDKGGKMLGQGPGVLMLLSLVMLFIRSCLHVQAGISGLRETSLDRAVELANRYANFGIISAFCAGGALLLIAMTSKINLIAIVGVTGVCWLLMAWPMIIRRFFSDRQFADLLAGDNANVHRRAPDAGLSGLGWLLLGAAMLTATTLIPHLIMGSDGSTRNNEDTMFARIIQLMSLGPSLGLRSIWWNAGLVLFQAWAGWELIRMSPHSRIIATAFAVTAAGVTLYISWPMIEAFKAMRHVLDRKGEMMVFGMIGIQFVVPVATLILVNRKIAPTARARFRVRPAAPSSSPSE